LARGGGGGLGGVAAAGVAANGVAAAAGNGAVSLPAGVTAGALEPSSAQTAALTQGAIQMAQTAVSSPEFMRGARLVELGQSKGCTFIGAGAVAAPQH
jgi:hypothetical protein